ncbi:MAG TPA: (Fe-S)-binding protein [Limnochordales bacterium]
MVPQWNPAEATREVFWNISPAGVVVMYLLAAASMGVFAYGVWRHVRMWRRGKPAHRLRPVGPRLARVVRHVLAHGRLLADRVAGLYHLGMFWGFVVLFVGTTVVFVHHDLGIRIMRGYFYLYFQSAALDAMGLVAAVAVAVALWQRYVVRSPRLRRGVWSDAAILALFETVLVSGFVVEGLRIAATRDPWGSWSFVGFAVARAVQAAGWGEPALRAVHGVVWWFHFAVTMAFLAYIPYSKLFHLVLAPLNVYLQPLQAPGSPRPLDLEASERLGVAAFSDFSWKDLFDLDVCTECGRCTAVCPAHMTGKPLSPMQLVLDLRDEMKRTGGADGRLLAGEVIGQETLWACTTCMACMQACPVFIEHVPKIVDLRRHLVMEQGQVPATMQEALRGLEVRGHPFRGATARRSDWYAGLDVVELGKAGSADGVDVVYWAGCAAAFDERNQRVARALVTVLRRAGLVVGVLGEQERCTGDPARRMGHEFLFQELARANIETLNSLGVQELLTSCPHCYHTFRNEYPQLGARFRVRHHTELLEQLVREGRLALGAGGGRLVTYHDPCYLGRYGGLFDAPRAVLDALAGPGPAAGAGQSGEAAAASGLRRVEMPRCRERSLCCGAGGGRAWVEERGSQRVSLVRAREALATGADTVAVACPFCMQMLEDAVKGVSEEGQAVQVRDIAELVEEASRPEVASAADGRTVRA